jgi:peptidoglycan/xylan/chitin deacetylase (PgdA/CDA1 family)
MTILAYHSVHADWSSPLAVTPDDFTAQATWIARRRTVVPVQTAIARMSRSGRLPAGMTALSFDDGFVDNLETAAPVLARLQLPWTLCVVAQTLTPEGQAVDWVDTPPPWTLRTLSADQVVELHRDGVHIGSHSWAHRDLTQLGYAECVRDLRSSRELLEDLLHTPVPLLAYPRGRHNAMVRTAAATAGYTHALALPQQHEVPGRYAVPRVGVFPGNTLATLRLKSSRAYLPVRTHPAFPAARRGLHPVIRALGAGTHS